MLKRLGLPALLFVVALLLLAGRSALERLAAPPTTPPKTMPTGPDYTMKQMHTRRFDRDGRLIRDLRADFVEHYPDARGSHMLAPLLSANAKTGNPWLIQSREGTAPPGEKEFHLSGDVRIDRAAGPANEETHITTDSLRVLPDENYAETGDPARITGQGMQTNGVGLKAWLDEERLELLEQVRGQYVSKPHSKTPGR